MMLLWMPKVLEQFRCDNGVGIVSFGVGIVSVGAGIVSVQQSFIWQYVFL